MLCYIAGIILVHDLTNRKSQQNLKQWLLEVLLMEKSNLVSKDTLVDNFDAEQFGAFAKVYESKQVSRTFLLKYNSDN